MNVTKVYAVNGTVIYVDYGKLNKGSTNQQIQLISPYDYELSTTARFILPNQRVTNQLPLSRIVDSEGNLIESEIIDGDIDVSLEDYDGEEWNVKGFTIPLSVLSVISSVRSGTLKIAYKLVRNDIGGNPIEVTTIETDSLTVFPFISDEVVSIEADDFTTLMSYVDSVANTKLNTNGDNATVSFDLFGVTFNAIPINNTDAVTLQYLHNLLDNIEQISFIHDGGTAVVSYTHTDGNNYQVLQIAYPDGRISQINEEQYVNFRNETGTTLNSGRVLMSDGVFLGNQAVSGVFFDENSPNANYLLGVVTVDGITNNTKSKATRFGIVEDINVSAFFSSGQAYVEGDLLYARAGRLSNVAPSKPSKQIKMGYVINANGNSYDVFICPQILYDFTELSDVTFTHISGNVPISDGNKLINFDLTQALSNIYDGTVAVGRSIQDQNGEIIDETYERLDNKGATNGYAPVVDGKIPSNFVPNSFDDVLEFDTYADLTSYPSELRRTNTLYVVLADENTGGDHSIYRWSGSIFILVHDELSASEIKTLYEGNANTNAFTDAEKQKLLDLYTRLQLDGILNDIDVALNDRPTFTQLQVELNQLKSIYGWEDSDLGSFNNADTPQPTFAYSLIEDYDFVLATWKELDATPVETYTVYFKPSDFIDGHCVRTQIQNNPFRVGCLSRSGTTITVGVVDNNNNLQASEDATVYLTGVKLSPLDATKIATTYTTTNYLDDETNQDEVNIKLDTEVKRVEDKVDVNSEDIKSNTLDIKEQTQRMQSAEEKLRNMQTGEAHLEVEGKDLINLPENVADGSPLSVEIQGRTVPALTNLVTNGDFALDTNADGLADSWAKATVNHTTSLTNGVQRITYGTATTNYIALGQPYTFEVGSVYYIKSKFTTTLSTRAIIIRNGGIGSGIIHNISYQNAVSFIASANATYITFYSDTTPIITSYVELSKVGIFNLTALYGVTATSGEAYDNAVAQIEDMLALNGGYIDTTPITHVENTEIVGVGKNLFDGIENGGINGSNGIIDNTVTRANRTKNFIKIQPSIAYRISLLTSANEAVIVYYYDNNKTYLGASSRTFLSGSGGTFTPPTNASYIKVAFANIASPALPIDNNYQLEQGTTATPYQPYISNRHIFNHPRLSGLPNGVSDKVRVSNGKYVFDKYVQEYTLQESDVINYITSLTNNDIIQMSYKSDMVQAASSNPQDIIIPGFISLNNGDIDSVSKQYTFYKLSTSYRLIVPKGTYANLAEAQADLAGTKIYYQLATPILNTEIPNAGNLLGFSKGVVEVNQRVSNVGYYDTSFEVTDTSKPILSLHSIEKLNTDDTTTPLDISTAVIAGDGLSFTHPVLTANDIVIVRYNIYAITPNIVVDYLNSRAVVQDETLGTFKRWRVQLDNGVFSIVGEDV